MAPERETTSTTVQQTATGKRLDELDIEARESIQDQLIRFQQESLELGTELFKGGENLPGAFADLPFGISEDVTSGIVTEGLRDVASGAQFAGILDSGVAASAAVRTAGDIRTRSAEFNIGNLQNLINLALGQAAQVQSPILGQGAALGTRLSALSGSTSTTIGANPFLKAFQTGAGTALGKGVVGGAGGLFPGGGGGGSTASLSSIGAGSTVSSIDFKKNVKENTIDSISILDDIDIVEFDYKDIDKKHHIGFILEDSPELISGEGGKHIDMINMIGVLVDSNKKLLARVRKLEEVSNG